MEVTATTATEAVAEAVDEIFSDRWNPCSTADSVCTNPRCPCYGRVCPLN